MGGDMNFSMTSILIGLVTGAVGFVYIRFGRKADRPAVFIAGLLLCVLPYFLDNTVVLSLACLVLAVAPWYV